MKKIELTSASMDKSAMKAVYEKPTMQVYEMEVEGAILAGSDTRISNMEYESPWE